MPRLPARPLSITVSHSDTPVSLETLFMLLDRVDSDLVLQKQIVDARLAERADSAVNVFEGAEKVAELIG